MRNRKDKVTADKSTRTKQRLGEDLGTSLLVIRHLFGRRENVVGGTGHGKYATWYVKLLSLCAKYDRNACYYSRLRNFDDHAFAVSTQSMW